ncbi:histidine kinase [uncultured Draconibacterium sp.]|uniref:histidine kinase n=1 Tax=uncultured Draconibacterium sp. TaxID=1573823 RepID=UPI0032167A4F
MNHSITLKTAVVGFLLAVSVVCGIVPQVFALAPYSESDSLKTAYELRISNAVDSLEKLNANYDYARYLDEQDEVDGSIHLLKQALKTAQNSEYHKEVAMVANYLAGVYIMQGEVESSTNTYLEALQSAEITGNNTEIAKISMNLAGNYNFYGDYTNAIKYGLYALETKESSEDWVRICYHYMAMSNIFKETGNLEKREEYNLLAYKMKDVEGCASNTDIAKIYNGLGGIAEERLEHEKALAYYDTLMVFSKEVGFDQGIGTALTNSSLIYMELNEYEKALEMVLEAEKYSDGTPYDTVFSNNCKIEIYMALGEAQKALDLALENISKEEISYYSAERLKSLRFLYELNFQLKNYDEAYNWNDSLQAYEEYLRDEDVRSTMEDLETKYQTEKKEQQIELLTTENLLRKRVMQAAIVIVIILVLLVVLITYILQIRKKQAKYIQGELQQQVLRSQMNPHFIFNVLGSIQNYMLSNDSKKAAGYLSKFASLTRATLEYSSEDTIALSDEISMLQNYMELEQMRKPGVFEFRMEYAEELEVDFIQIPPMMIQPFIENAIKHGFKNIDYKGDLVISFADKMEFIEVLIQDNGTGIQREIDSGKQHRSMAMDIFEKRRKLIQHKFNKDFNFELINLTQSNSAETGVRVTLTIPVLNND